MKRVLVPIAHGTEEMEAITIIDILRRAGIAVRVSKVIGSDPDESLACKMSRNVIVEAESKIQSEVTAKLRGSLCEFRMFTSIQEINDQAQY